MLVKHIWTDYISACSRQLDAMHLQKTYYEPTQSRSREIYISRVAQLYSVVNIVTPSLSNLLIASGEYFVHHDYNISLPGYIFHR